MLELIAGEFIRDEPGLAEIETEPFSIAKRKAAESPHSRDPEMPSIVPTRRQF